MRDLRRHASLRHPERHQQLHAASEEAQVRDLEVLLRRHLQRIQGDGETRQALPQVRESQVGFKPRQVQRLFLLLLLLSDDWGS